jgi:hypothetical protein
MTRALIDISSLDVRVQEQVAKHGDLKNFHVALWRQDPDASGCNWNARIERVGGGANQNHPDSDPDSANDSSWWDVVPQMRERFNLN